jgi:hypothetical protein
LRDVARCTVGKGRACVCAFRSRSHSIRAISTRSLSSACS